MSLSQTAAARAAVEREEARARGKAKRAETREKMVERLMTNWRGEPSEIAEAGYEVKWIDSRQVEYPVRGSRYGAEYVYVTSKYVYRFRVDDVVVWAWEGDRSGCALFSPQVECSECGRETCTEFCEGVYVDAHGTDGDELVAAIKSAAGRTFRCPWCTTELPRTCPTCGRGNV